MNDILFGVLQAVIVAAVAAIARYLIPYIRERLAATRYAWLVDVIDAAVRGAEQMIGPGHGSEKKAQAAEFISHPDHRRPGEPADRGGRPGNERRTVQGSEGG